MPSKEDAQIITSSFEPFSTISVPNHLDYPIKMTVKFSGSESVSFTVIKGGVVTIKCGEVAPTIILDDIEHEAIGDPRFQGG